MVHLQRLLLSLFLGLTLAGVPATAENSRNGGTTANPTSQQHAPATSEVRLSLAERILRLERSITETRAELAEAKQEFDDPESEYAKAKEQFTRLDLRLKERERAAATQPAADPTALDGLRDARELAKKRFDLAIEEYNALQRKITVLERKLQQDTEALQRMKSPAGTTSQPAGAAVPPGPSEAHPQPGPTPAPQPVPPQATVKVPGLPVPTPSAQQPAAEPAPEAEPATRMTPAVRKEHAQLQESVRERRTEAERAEEYLKFISDRIATLRDSIATEQDLLEKARKRVEVVQQQYTGTRRHVDSLITTGAPAEEVSTAWARVDDAEKRAAEAEADRERSRARLDELRVELDDLQAEHIAALQDADRARREAERAEGALRRLENPFSLFRILQWLIEHGPRIVGIALAMTALLWLTKLVEHRIVRFITLRGDTGSEPEREARAKTLASVFRNFGSTAVVIGGSLMLLSEVGINIVPLLGAAGVVGLAVAFGAQSLIKDYFSGFIILLENQYAINDVIRIGDTAGLVEHISLRMTKLRDIEGNAHFVPHGEIKSVTNMTHGWSRAVFNIRVAYKENVDEVMKVLMSLGNELCQDPVYRPLILEGPEMQGVENFGDSAVVIRFLIKTRPLRQWMIRREMLRRIKNRFDELGIEIPFPHRTVYHRYESDANGEPDVLSPIQGSGRTR